MAKVILAHLTFESDANAQFIYDQIKAVMVNTSVARIGEAGERTSYCNLMVEQPDGVLVPDGDKTLHVDAFGIVREGPFDNSDAPLWIQPTGAQNAYPALNLRGEQTKVTHNGQVWLNAHGDGNIWVPGVFGWVLA